jgi:hypothetical protein
MRPTITLLARTFQSTRTRRRREQYMPLVAFCPCHFLADFTICMCEFDFRQAHEERATRLLHELTGLAGEIPSSNPDPSEMAKTAARTLAFADIAELRAHLVPEVPIWSSAQDGILTAGRADAVAVQGDAVLAVLDWKSDVSPSSEDRSGHIGQLTDYLTAVGAAKGAVVYMSLGEVVWIVANANHG